MLVARSAFVIIQCHWLRLTTNQVSVAIIVSADACMQGVQGSNPADDQKVARRSTVFFAVEFNLSSKGAHTLFSEVFIVNNFILYTITQFMTKTANYAFNSVPSPYTVCNTIHLPVYLCVSIRIRGGGCGDVFITVQYLANVLGSSHHLTCD